MAQIHELESKSRFGTKYIVGIILVISTLLIAGWIGFFVFLPIKSGMNTVYELEERFLPRAEGMVLDFVSLSEPSIIITSDDVLLDELHDGLNRDPIKLSDVPPFVINTLLAAEDSNYYQHEGVDFIAILSAVLDNLRGVTRGGSTITSQVAKQSFVGDEISIRRKVAEAVVAAGPATATAAAAAGSIPYCSFKISANSLTSLTVKLTNFSAKSFKSAILLKFNC